MEETKAFGIGPSERDSVRFVKVRVRLEQGLGRVG